MLVHHNYIYASKKHTKEKIVVHNIWIKYNRAIVITHEWVYIKCAHWIRAKGNDVSYNMNGMMTKKCKKPHFFLLLIFAVHFRSSAKILRITLKSNYSAKAKLAETFSILEMKIPYMFYIWVGAFIYTSSITGP